MEIGIDFTKKYMAFVSSPIRGSDSLNKLVKKCKRQTGSLIIVNDEGQLVAYRNSSGIWIPDKLMTSTK